MWCCKFQMDKRHSKETQADREFQTLSKSSYFKKLFSHTIDKFKKEVSKQKSVVLGTSQLKRSSL